MVGEGEAVKIKKKAGGSPGAVDTPTDSLQQRKGKGVCVEGGGDGDPSRVSLIDDSYTGGHGLVTSGNCKGVS